MWRWTGPYTCGTYILVPNCARFERMDITDAHKQQALLTLGAVETVAQG